MCFSKDKRFKTQTLNAFENLTREKLKTTSLYQRFYLLDSSIIIEL